MEINPLVAAKNEKLIGLDARVEIEDEAVYRQRETVGAVRRIDADCCRSSTHPPGAGSHNALMRQTIEALLDGL